MPTRPAIDTRQAEGEREVPWARRGGSKGRRPGPLIIPTRVVRQDGTRATKAVSIQEAGGERGPGA